MSPQRPAPIVVLISGRGSNMRAVIEASRRGSPSYEVAQVFSNEPSAAGLGIARDLGIDTRVVPSKSVERRIFERTLTAAIDESRPALIVLAGFMRILTLEFVAHYAGRILNIHPSLLPAYAGLHTHRRVLEAGELQHGATVHFVTAELDGGPAIVQGRIRVQPDDDETTIAARVQAVEHRIYPMAVSWYCEGRLRCDQSRARLDGAALDTPVLYDY